ncbi:MAG TPA: tyrosine-type recombinase/integrase [Gammaproteobacteria bacterium]|nr:tyrosine-type recombinase/integrase [Gammaproteobacteria bacterium]
MAYYILTSRGDSYRVQIRVKSKSKVVYTQTKSFKKKAAAESWAKRRVIELEEVAPSDRQADSVTVGSMIGRYIKEYAELSGFGRTKRAALEALMRTDLARVLLVSLSAPTLIAHVVSRRKSGAGPATVQNDLIWLSVVAKAARASWGYPVDLQAIEDAVRHCRAQRLVTKSRRRTRRPTADELDRLSKHFQSRDGRAEIPMHDLMWFAVYSGRREAEITRLLRSDNNPTDLTGVVRDLKHPTLKGINRVFKYTREAWEIMQRQPQIEDRIFPYNAKSVSAAFTRACHILEIADLRFHDLRHEATSRLFEAGYSIVEVQQFTLHESWDVLKRYVQLRPGQVKHREPDVAP